MKVRRRLRVLMFLALMVGMLTMSLTANAAKLNKTKIKLSAKATYQLKLKGASKVTWKSSNKKVATVNSKGLVRGVEKGSAKITATAGKKSYTCKVTVTNPVTIEFDVGEDEPYVLAYRAGNTLGEDEDEPSTVDLNAYLKMNKKAPLAWKSSNTSVATVEDGVVTGVSNGRVRITATVKDGSNTKASVTVVVSGVRSKNDKAIRLTRSNWNTYFKKVVVPAYSGHVDSKGVKTYDPEGFRLYFYYVLKDDVVSKVDITRTFFSDEAERPSVRVAYRYGLYNITLSEEKAEYTLGDLVRTYGMSYDYDSMYERTFRNYPLEKPEEGTPYWFLEYPEEYANKTFYICQYFEDDYDMEGSQVIVKEEDGKKTYTIYCPIGEEIAAVDGYLWLK